MEPRISIVTLGVEEFAKAYDFYTSLGFETSAGREDPIAFFKTNGTLLAIYPRDKLAEDVGADVPREKAGFGGVTLAHNVDAREKVDAVLAQAQAAGGTIVKPAQDTFWGGYSGYFADPDGHYWEVAYADFWEFDERQNLVV